MKTKQTKQKQWLEYGSRFSVAGVQYSDYQQITDKKIVGNTVRFIGEPYNAFDPKAIRIEYKGVKIGYVPSRTEMQRGLWEEHNNGAAIVGVITAVNHNNPSWNLFTVQVLVNRPKKRLTQNEGDVLFANMRADLSYR